MKSNVLLTILALFFGVQFTNAQTIIYGGPVEGYWSKSESPYIIRGYIYIEDKKTLEIEAGVEIIFGSTIPMTVNGRLLALGNDTDTILFTTEQPDRGWGGIRFEDILSGNEASKLSFCKFEHASAKGEWPFHSGGAIGIKYTNKLSIENCLFENNKALDNESDGDATRVASGGAIAIWLSEVRLSKNVFRYNEAINGGAVFIDKYSKAVIDNSLFYSNTAMNYGGAVAVSDHSTPGFINCTFADNYANNKGGAVSASNQSSPMFLNSILWENGAMEDGNQINVMGSSDFNIFQSNIEKGLEGISGYKYAKSNQTYYDFNPEFTHKGSYPYMIASTSPCIDLGTLDAKYLPQKYMHPATDIFGNRRISGNSVDMGFAEAELYPIDHTIETVQLEQSSNEYSDWDEITNTGSQSDFIAVHFTDDNHGWVAAEDGTLIYTTDRGLSWNEHDFGPSVHLVDVYFLDEQTGFVIGTIDIGAYTYGIAYKTKDGGETWELSYITESSVIFNSIEFTDSQKGFIAGYSISPSGSNGFMIKTEDAGESWENVSVSALTVKFDQLMFNAASQGWMVGITNIGPREVSAIFKTEDGGATWNTTHIEETEILFKSISFFDTQNGIAVGNNGSILSTINSGDNWKAQNIGRYSFNSALAGDAGSAWAIGDDGMIISTNNSGQNWTQEYTLKDTDLNAICNTPGDFLWVVGDEGTLYMQKPISIDDGSDDNQEVDFSLLDSDLLADKKTKVNSNINTAQFVSHKNFPNPFTGQTTISFEIDQATHVTLKVYSINGQHISTLKDQHIEAGFQEVKFNASDLTPGMYTYVLSAGNHVENGKMIINN